jgi:hypothetical protein
MWLLYIEVLDTWAFKGLKLEVKLMKEISCSPCVYISP